MSSPNTILASTIITMNAAQPRVEALAFDADTHLITAIGTLAQCQKATPGATVSDLGATAGVFTLVFIFIGGLLSGIDWRVAFLLITIASLTCFFLAPIVLPVQEPVRKGKQDI